MKEKKALKLTARMGDVGASNAIRKFNINLNAGRKSLAIAAASLALSAVALPASATNWWNPAPTVSVGSTVINVKNMGAMGNGVNNDTAAFQAAINALPAAGGTIDVPNGTYMINGLVGITLKSHVRISMQANASLNEIANSAQRSWVMKVWNVNNVEIVGGHIVGERNGHSGTTGQWGYGLNIEGSTSVYVHDIDVSNCFGDGVLVGGTGSGGSLVISKGVTLARVKSTNNRRQGLTIAPSNQVYVFSSTFNGSNGPGAQSGIDIEPETQGSVSQVRIENSVMSNNGENGLELHDNVNGVSLVGSTAQNNKGYGVFDSGANTITVDSNHLIQNYLFGIDIAGNTSNVSISNNDITYNGDTWFYAHNESIFTEGWDPRDITIARTTSGVSQSNNTVSPQR